MFIFHMMTRLQDNSDNVQLECIVITRFYKLVFVILQFKVMTIKSKWDKNLVKLKIY